MYERGPNYPKNTQKTHNTIKTSSNNFKLGYKSLYSLPRKAAKTFTTLHKVSLLAPKGAQGVKMCVCVSGTLFKRTLKMRSSRILKHPGEF